MATITAHRMQITALLGIILVMLMIGIKTEYTLTIMSMTTATTMVMTQQREGMQGVLGTGIHTLSLNHDLAKVVKGRQRQRR